MRTEQITGTEGNAESFAGPHSSSGSYPGARIKLRDATLKRLLQGDHDINSATSKHPRTPIPQCIETGKLIVRVNLDKFMLASMSMAISYQKYPSDTTMNVWREQSNQDRQTVATRIIAFVYSRAARRTDPRKNKLTISPSRGSAVQCSNISFIRIRWLRAKTAYLLHQFLHDLIKFID